MTMTLKEVRNQIASLEGDDSRRKAWVAAIDAHIAGIGEPVAWMCETLNGYVAFSRDGKFPCNAGKVTALYTHPAAPVGVPVATLHADGYWAWNGIPPHESNYAGWKMAVYTAPPIDIAVVREVIADLEKFSTSGRDVRLAAKLTAALPKEVE